MGTVSSGKYSRLCRPGQNLVELLFTLPLTLILFFAMLEVTHIWVMYQGVKMAARDAVYTAAIYHDPGKGQAQFTRRVQTLDLQNKSISIQPIGVGQAYQATVTASVKPFYASMTIPTLSGDITLLPGLPNPIPINYTLSDVAVY